MNTRKKILILGYGIVGGMVLDNFCRSAVSHEIYVAGRNADKLTRRAHTSIFSAINLGFNPSVKILPIDIMNEIESVELLSSVKPDIIFNATSLLSWWHLDSLSSSLLKKIKCAGDGAWTPIDIILPYKLMKAVSNSGIKAIVVNASYADVVNPSLHRVGLGPTTGIGNVANTIPALKLAVSDELAVPISEIEIKFVAHHSVSHAIPSYGHTNGAPCHLTVYLNGNVCEDISAERLFLLSATRYKRVRGVEGQLVTASSATQILEAIANDTPLMTHAPGPQGYIGGYPIEVNGNGVSLSLPANLSLTEAEQINTEAQKWDGIEAIELDGTIRFTDESVKIMKETLHFECSTMRVKDCEGWALELLSKYQQLVNKQPYI